MATTTITGFHQDADGDWVAELACGHSQHVRHRPPWQLRPWAATEVGRAERVGQEIECPLCERRGDPRGAGDADRQ
jgi:hypothetical protein